MNLLFRYRCDWVLESLLCLSRKRDIDAVELRRGLEIKRLRQERRSLRQRIACMEEAQRVACLQIETAAELNEQTRLELERLMRTEERNPDDGFIKV